MRVILLLMLLFFLVHPALCVSIVEFYPDTYVPQDTDEYLVIEGNTVLDGITISDGEGGFRFPDHSSVAGRITVALQGVAFRQVHGVNPDFELYDTSPSVPDVIRGGRFQMSNAGDQLFLYQDGVLLQKVSWPEEVTAREGQVHFWEDGRWDPRPLSIGQSRFTTLTVENVTLTAFVSPDSSYEVFAEAVSEADRSLRVNIYEFSSLKITSLFLEAQRRGVEEEFLLEGGPVGGILPEEHCALRTLADQGVTLRVMETNGTTHAKYQFDHAKYVIVDDTGVLIASENFNDNGFPLPGRFGNRGWGVYLRDPRMAEYFQQVFDWDIAGDDVTLFQPRPSTCLTTTPAEYTVEFPSQEFTGARVTTVLAPDTSMLIPDLIGRARLSVDIEQAYVKNYSHNTPNPFLEEAIQAARRGVVVRVLLDSSWFNINEAQDNDEMAAYINELGRTEGIPITARCADLKNNHLDKIHNKGVIVDGEHVLISSVNWNEQSPSFNREAGVIIEHPGVGAYYQKVFNDDWNASTDGPATGIDFMKLETAGLVILVLAGLYFFRIRR
ncbi:MAG: phospholipase D-like domain-containing protein [Methanomicrobiales archaeon]|nr:phospholipase D-like domain-containing protein [Methanomicrobiales archaeon]